MNIFYSRFSLKQKIFQKQLNHYWQLLFDSHYRNVTKSFNCLESILSEPKYVEENIELKDLNSWTPIEIKLSNQHQSVAWLDLGQIPFTDAVFIDTVYRSWQNQNRPQPIWTQLDALMNSQKISSSLRPKGFIFNISKCGSTLLSRMLSSLPRNLVISESQVVSQALKANSLMLDADNFSESFRVELLQIVISALGQPRLGIEENYLIRLNPNLIFYMPFIRKVFPDIPFIFLYRDPIEVLVSQVLDLDNLRLNEVYDSYLTKKTLNLCAIDLNRMDSEYSDIVKHMLDFSASNIHEMSVEEFHARRLGMFFRMVLHQLDENILLVNYSELTTQIGLLRLLDFLKINVSSDELLLMLDKLKIYSKDYFERKIYSNDSLSKQKVASSKVRYLVDKWVMEPYLELEKARYPQAAQFCH